MSIGIKRYAFLIHRWTGISMCILMALWFVSGIVMLFVGYPKLTPWERLRTLPPLADRACCISPSVALALSNAPADVKEVTLTSIANRPHYILKKGDGSYTVVDALSGNVKPEIDRSDALASAKAYMPGASAEYVGTFNEDRWTHSRSLNVHRPLHVVQMHDQASTLLYMSSSTGQVMLDAPFHERAWNFFGAWLHWLYMFRNHPIDPVWTWTLIFISAMGVVTALTGTLNGIWRWRFTKTYRNGAHTPFREPYMRWHHTLGLVFGAILCTWIFSGLMSMNPLGIFDAKGKRPDEAAYHGETPANLRLPLTVPEALTLLREHSFHPSELEWRVMNGSPFILARSHNGETRLITHSGNRFAVMQRWNEQDLRNAASNLLPFVSIRSYQMLEAYDAHYFKRQTESMYGGYERRLPALRIIFDDPEETWVHLDVHTGQVELSADRSQRTGRWLFNFLHSWDLPSMLKHEPLRKSALVLLSMGGFILCFTAMVIATRRLYKWKRKVTPFSAFSVR